jgi:cell division protein FtsZ
LTVKDETPLRFELEVAETKAEEIMKPVIEEKEEETTSMLNMLYEEKKTEESTVNVPSFLSRPSAIYAQSAEKPAAEVKKEELKKEEPKKEESKKVKQQPLFEEETMEFDIVIKDEAPARPTPAAVFNLPANDEEEEQKRRAEERIHKLRNLSYNMNSMDNNNEYEMCRPMCAVTLNYLVITSLLSVEDFYSKVAVKKDENITRKFQPSILFLMERNRTKRLA